MKKLLVFLALFFCSTVSAFDYEWIACHQLPIPEHDHCIFYEQVSDQVILGYPDTYRIFISFTYDQTANITHWMRPPPKPREMICEYEWE